MQSLEPRHCSARMCSFSHRPSFQKTLAERCTYCRLKGGGTGRFTPRNLATVRANVASGLSPFAMNALHRQLCDVSGMSDDEVEELKEMLATAPMM